MDNLIIFGAKYLVLAVIFLWIVAWWQANRNFKKQIAWTTFIAVVVAGVLDQIANKIYYDPRPFVSHHLQPLVAHAADNGFPSEHTLFSMTLAVSLLSFRPKLGWTAVVTALIIGAARVAAHVHSPIDIAGGALIGAVAGYVGYRLARRFIEKD